MELFKRSYSDESAYDLAEDVMDALNPEYNSLVKEIPMDEWSFRTGTFTVTITWEP